MNRPMRKRTISSKKDYYTIIMMSTVIGALIYRFFLGKLIGDKGIACFAAANEIYLVIAGTISYGLSEAVAMLVKYRVKREQFKSSQKVLRGALLLGGGIGLIFSVFFGVFGDFAAQKIMHIPLAGLSVRLMAPAMFFVILTGVFRGYFQGNGSHIPSMHSQILHMVFMFVGGLIGAMLYQEYGTKVSALLQNEDYTSAYGAKGAAIGFLAASIICFLHVVILFFIYSRSMKGQISRESQRNQDMGVHILSMLIGTGAIYALYWFSFNGLSLIDQYLFFLLGESSGEAVADWGIYYGKCLVLFGVIGGVINMFCLSPIRRIMGLVERDERQLARERLGILIHQCAVTAIPAAVLLAVLAENILEIMFFGDKQQAAVWVELGSIIIVLSVFSAVFMEILIRSRKLKYAAFTGIGVMVLHMLLLFILLKTTKSGITAVLISNVVFYTLVAGAGFFIVSRSFQYTQEWIRTFALTAIISAVSGVLAMLLNKLFSPMLGAAISMIICLLTASIAYVVLLLVMRAFRDGELEEMTGGRLLLLLAGVLHLS